MGLTSWSGSVVRKSDVGVAKNYLHADEIEQLNLIVTMYLDYAELQAKGRRAMTMADWGDKLHAFLRFNERDLLTHAGTVRAEVAKRLTDERYAHFDSRRRSAELAEADVQDRAAIAALEQAAGEPKRKGGADDIQ